MADLKTYIVISELPIVVVDGGASTSYDPGQTFQEFSSNASIIFNLEQGRIAPVDGLTASDIASIGSTVSGGLALSIEGLPLTLAADNTTGTNDIVIVTGQQIVGGRANFGLADQAVSDGDIAAHTAAGPGGFFYDASTAVLSVPAVSTPAVSAGAAALQLTALGTDYDLSAAGALLTTTAQDLVGAINELDAELLANNELAEILVNGNITGGSDIVITSGDQVAGGRVNLGAATDAISDGDLAAGTAATGGLFYDASALTLNLPEGVLTRDTFTGDYAPGPVSGFFTSGQIRLAGLAGAAGEHGRSVEIITGDGNGAGFYAGSLLLHSGGSARIDDHPGGPIEIHPGDSINFNGSTIGIWGATATQTGAAPIIGGQVSIPAGAVDGPDPGNISGSIIIQGGPCSVAGGVGGLGGDVVIDPGWTQDPGGGNLRNPGDVRIGTFVDPFTGKYGPDGWGWGPPPTTPGPNIFIGKTGSTTTITGSTVADWVNVGAATDAVSAGDLAAGTAATGGLFYDASATLLTAPSISAGTSLAVAGRWTVDATQITSTSNAFVGSISNVTFGTESSGTTSPVLVASGDATAGNSGNVSVDTGSATGTAGSVNVGTTNASAVNIGVSGAPVNLAGDLLINGLAQTERLSTTSVDATAIGPTALFTVPAGKTIAFTRASVRLTAVAALTSVPTLGIGIGAGEDDVFIPETLIGLDATNKAWWFSAESLTAVGTSGQTISVGVDAAAVAGTYTISVDLFGYEV